MANEEHLKILLQGVEVWNQWRESHPEIEPDLRETSLRKAYLNGVNFSETNLFGATLSETNLNEATLLGATLFRANLFDATLFKANLWGADLREATLFGANLSNTNFTEANFGKASFWGANLSGANLSGASFKEADLRRVNFRNVNFSNADLSNANLSNANLSNTNLTKVNLSGADLREAILSRVNLSNTNLSKANLNKANLSKANLSKANLREADLGWANLREADLSWADLRGASLREADLRWADLSWAGFNGADLRNVDLSFVKSTNLILTRALIGNTRFCHNDLSRVVGLDSVTHQFPSSIGIETLQKSRGNIPEVFLRDCGLNDWEIENAKLYDPDLSNEEIIDIQYRIHDLRVKRAFQINPLFISYNHSNSDFVDIIEKYLIKEGIRFWRDIHHATAGRLETLIDKAIDLNDTVLLVLSEHSTKSIWVEHEARKAIKKRGKTGKNTLCPVALDDSWKTCNWPERLREQIMEYNILDFSNWQDNNAFQRVFRKLLEGLNLFYK